MITVKLPYTTESNFDDLFRQYSCVLRFAYNRFLEDKTEKDIRLLIKGLNNINIGSWIIQCAIKDAQAIHKRTKECVFGGKYNFKQLVRNKITKEQYKEQRLSNVNIQGEILKYGNRSFNLNIINDNSIIFKVDKRNHYRLELPKLRNNIKNKLFQLEKLAKQKSITYSIRISKCHIYISYEEPKLEIKERNESRYLAIDMNPKCIGISVVENETILHTQEYNFKEYIDQFLSKKLNSRQQKPYHNKLQFETIIIAKEITKLADHYNCKFIFIEDLRFKESTTNTQFNRVTKSIWKKNLFVDNLKKRCSIESIKVYSVNPVYTSFIGNLQYEYTDSINASLEIGRRGYSCIIKKKKDSFYPRISVKHLWKEMIAEVSSWKELFSKIKNSGLMYRVSLSECNSFSVFKMKSINSRIKIIQFNKV